jgi:hypothetical protein
MDADPDEGKPAVGKEAGQRGGHVVGVADLEDEAAAVNVQLQHSQGATPHRGPP